MLKAYKAELSGDQIVWQGETPKRFAASGQPYRHNFGRRASATEK